MEYLIYGSKTQFGEWNATILDSNDPMFDIVKQLLTTNEQTPTITYDNYNVINAGYMLTDNIENVETTIRAMGFRKCDICGSWVTPQDRRSGASTYENGVRKCPKCVEKEQYELSINPHIVLEDYHGTSHLVRVINGDGENFTLDNVLGIGIEIEYNSRNASNRNILKCTPQFYELAKSRSRNRVFRCEHDCTVQGEIISNIFTKKSLYDFDWKILTDVLLANGNDTNIANVGLHVHLSKLWLGTTPKDQAFNFLKLQYFLKSYEYDFFKMSGRKRDEMGWCEFYSQSAIENMKANILRYSQANANPWGCMPSSHSYALISSGATIELRIGKSTNDPERIKHYLRFVLGIVENIKNVPFEKCYCIGKVTRLVPSETMNYWRKQGCFLNTNATENRGVTL